MDRLSLLAGLKLDDAEQSQMMTDIHSLCQMVDPIKQVDTKGVEPLISLVSRKNAFEPRDLATDSVAEAMPNEDLLSLGHRVQDYMYIVRKN